MTGRAPSPILVLCGLWIVVVIVVTLGAGAIAPFDQAFQQPRARLSEPSFLNPASPFLFGADHLGRDVISRVLHGLALSVGIALGGALVGACLGIAIGLSAGHARGLVDDVLMAIVDISASVPFIVVALACLALMGNSFELFVVLMGLAGWERYARLVRGLVLDGNSRDYVEAVEGLGAGPARVYGLHVLPNMLAPLVVQFTLNFPEIILLETGLSFLGLGVQPPLASLGLMMSEGRDHLATAWWIAVVPGICIFLTTLSVSLIGDNMRDRLDPTLGKH
jgi:peptide/nickel transport system permease protein